MSQKESEWEKEFEKNFVYYSRELKTWVFNFESTPQVVKSFIQKAISTREKEIAEEVKKLGGYSNFKEEVLQILNHNQ